MIFSIFLVYFSFTVAVFFILKLFSVFKPTVDLGQVGCHGDGGTLANSKFGRALESDQLPFLGGH